MEGATRDAFLGGQLQIWQPEAGYRAATDPVFLAASLPLKRGERVLDLGCGVGVAALSALARVPGARACGVECQALYAALARRNAQENNLALEIWEGDLRALPEALKAAPFDHVMLNPPFYPQDAATGPRDAGRDIAHREGAADLGVFLDVALRRVAVGGTVSVIHRAERLGDLLALLAGRAGDVEIKPLAPRAGRPAGRVILRARKGRKGPLVLHAPLVIHEGAAHSGDGESYSQAASGILRCGKMLDF